MFWAAVGIFLVIGVGWQILKDRADAEVLRERKMAKEARKLVASRFTAKIAPLDLHIKYEDGIGQLSERTVTIDYVMVSRRKKGPYVRQFTGVCHLRHDTRTFLTDAVKEASDPATGEVIADPSGWILAKLKRVS